MRRKVNTCKYELKALYSELVYVDTKIIRHYTERKTVTENENKNIVFQKLWDAMKAVLRGKYATIQAFLKKK